MRSILKATRECKPEIVSKHEVVTWDPSIFSTTSLFKPKKSKGKKISIYKGERL